MSAASENLKACQRQLDADGCEVGVSRQAVEEVLMELEIRVRQQVIMAQALDAIRTAANFDGARMSADIALIAVNELTTQLPNQ